MDKKIFRYILGGLSMMIFLVSISVLIMQIIRSSNSIAITGSMGRFNLFNFYTIQSNILVMAWTLTFSLGMFGREKMKKIASNPNIRGAISLYIFVTGAIFAVVLVPVMTKYYGPSKMDRMQTFFLNWQHYFIPGLMTILWFIPLSKERVSYKKMFSWIIYPAAYGIYTIIRGVIKNWYPYPFLNPEFSKGWINVVRNIGGLVVMFLILGAVFIFINRVGMSIYERFITERGHEDESRVL